MKIKSFLILFFSTIYSISYSQVQLGEDILGDAIGDNFGEAMAMSNDGTHIVIGSRYKDGTLMNSGVTRVYKYENEDWIQIGQDIYGEAQNDFSGTSVSISSNGDKIAIGATHNDGTREDSGHVRIYQFIGSTWIQIGHDIDGEAAGDHFGIEVSLSPTGDRIAIGADFNDGSAFNGGHVRVYENIDDEWIQIGQDIDGTYSNGWIGKSLSLSSNGNRIAINSPTNLGAGGNGFVQVYEFNGSNWIQIGANISDLNYAFGYSVSLSSDGNTIIIGTINGGSPDVSYVRAYEFNGQNWIQKGSKLGEEFYNGRFGDSVSISNDGTVIAIGDSRNDGNGFTSGNVQVFRFDNEVNDWIQIGIDIDGSNSYDYCGVKVSLSGTGNRVALGAKFHDGNGISNSGQVRVYDFTEFLLSTNDYEGTNLSVYPNPVSEVLIVKSKMQITRMVLYDLFGKIVATTFNDNKINCSNLNNQMYILKITDNNNNHTFKKIMKR